MGAGTSRAAVLVWTNTAGGYWQDTLSWTNQTSGGNGVPGVSDDASFTAAATYTVRVTNDVVVNSIDVNVGSGKSETLTLDLGGNSFSILKPGSGSPTGLLVGDANATDTLYLASSTGAGKGLYVTNSGLLRATLGKSGQGIMIVTNGFVQIGADGVANNQMVLGNNAPNAKGVLVLSGYNVSWKNNASMLIGNNAGAKFNSLTISNSASLTVSAIGGSLTVGALSGTSTNSLLLDSGGRLFITAVGGYVGVGAGNGNTATVQGGATWDNGNTPLTIGGTGTGNSVTIGAGGTVSNVSIVSIAAGNSLILSGGVLSVSIAVTNNSATIQGFGTIVGSTLFTGTGTLTPGFGTVVGTMVLSNNLTLVSGSTTTMKLDKSQTGSNDLVNVVGALTEAGTLTITSAGPALVGGDAFHLFAFGSKSGDFTVTNLPSLGGGLLWNSAQLGPQGIISVVLPPSMTGPTNWAAHIGDTVAISTSVTGVPAPTLQWQLGGTNLVDGPTGSGSTVSGSATTTLTVSTAQTNDTGQYCLIASNSGGSVTNCMALTVTPANAPPTITGPSDQTVIVGNDGTFSASAAGIPAPTIQWQENGTNITGATGTPLILTNVQISQSGYRYCLIASNSEGSATNCAVLHVVVPPTITSQPTNFVATVGQSASFSVATTNGVPAPGYQWYFNSGLIGGATSPTYTIAAVTAANMGTYKVVVANTAGSVTSSNATLTVNSTMTPVSLTPSNGATAVCYDTPLSIIFDQPPVLRGTGKVQVFNSADNVTPVDTIDTGLGAAQLRAIGGDSQGPFNTYPVIITGNTAAIYPHLGVLTFGQTYYVTVDPGTFTDTNAAWYAGITSTNGWVFSTKPTGPTNPHNLVVAADGSGDFATVQGAVDSISLNNTTYTLINIRNGTYTEFVDIRSKHNVTFRGQDRHQTIIRYPNNNSLNGSTHTRMSFKVYANDIAIENLTLTNSTPKSSIQAEALTLETNIKRFILNNAEVDSYQDTIYGNTSGTQAYFNNSLIQGDTDFIWGGMNAFFTNCEVRSVTTLSHITQARTDAGSNGMSFVNCLVTRLSNGVVNCDFGRATGYTEGNVAFIYCRIDDHITGWSDLSHRDWEYGNSNLAATAAVTYNGTQLTNGDDRVTLASIATNWLYGWAPQLAPNIIQQPTDQTVAVSQTATFNVSATGIPDPAYRWLKDGTNVVGATSATLVISDVQLTDAGVYSVVVSNSAGSVTSDNATLTTIIAPPAASFTASPTNGAVFLTVTFSDTSTGTITNRFWDFGDGNSSNTTAASMNHTYGIAVTNTVSLTVSGPLGTSNQTRVDYIVVTNPPPPTAAFSASPTTGAAPLLVHFTDNSSGTITNRFWDFGDGNTTNTTATTLDYTYHDAGTYTVSLTALGPGGSAMTNWPNYIIVGADTTPPNLQIVSPTDYQTFTNAGVTVSGVASDASGISGVTVNGSAATLIGTNWSRSVTLSWGTNTMTVIATDDSASLNTAMQVVHAILGSMGTPTNHPPQITAGLSVTNALLQVGTNAVVVANETNTFTVTTTDADNGPLAYQWVFGDGANTNTVIGIVDHVYTNDCGPYNASVTVSDGQVSTNGDLTVAVACQMQIIRTKAELNFKKLGADSCSLTANIVLPNGFTTTGKSMTVDIGGAQVSFPLSAKGKGVNAQGSCRLKFNKKTNAWTVTAKLRKGNWRTPWGEAGLVDSDVAKPGTTVTLTVVVLVGNKAFAADKALLYRAKAGKSGTAK